MSADTVGTVLAEVARLGGAAGLPKMRGGLLVLDTVLPAASAQDLVRRVSRLTGGEGVAETSFAGYQPVLGTQPTRPRTMANPLNRQEYMMQLRARASRATNRAP